MYESNYKNGQLESNGTYKYTKSAAYNRKDGVEALKFYDREGKTLHMEDGC